jgi:small subunit ribosomal protein S4
MAKNSTARGKIVRRFGLNIFGNPKYDRLLKKKPSPPGEPKKGRPRQSEFGRQLAEKQKVKFAYALSERQFRNVFEKAKRMKGVAGHNMLILLERRLDNVVYRLSMGSEPGSGPSAGHPRSRLRERTPAECSFCPGSSRRRNHH